MANLNENFSFDNVYQIEVTDSVLGGPGGTANLQAQALTNRTRYLLQLIQGLQSGTNASNLTSGTVPLTRLSGITNAQLDPNAAIDWAKVNKTGSSLADLTTRSASDLNTGIINATLLPAALQNPANFQLTSSDALRFKDSVATQFDVKTMGGLERATLVSDIINGQYIPRDKRITLSGPWQYQTNFGTTLGVGTYPIPSANPSISGLGNPALVTTNVAGSTVTVTFYGTGLNLETAKGGAQGTFTVSIDGGAATTYDNYAANNTFSFGQIVSVASGLALGSHTVVFTVTGTKGGGGASSDATFFMLGLDIISSTDGTIKNTSGNAFAASSLIAATSGSISPVAIGSAIYRKDLAYITKGGATVQIVQGYAGSAADSLATFKANNAIKYRVEAEDTSGKLASVWYTALSNPYLSNTLSAGLIYALGTPTSNSDTSGADYIIIGFIGTGCNVITYTGNGQGIFAYSVDGGAETTVDNYGNGAIANSQVSVNVAYNLPYGYHQVKIRKTGTKNAASSGYYINVDAFDIYHPVAPAIPANSIALSEILNTPSSGWIRHANQSEVLYSGANWSSGNGSVQTGGSYKINSNTNSTDTAKFTFTGTQFRLFLNLNASVGQFNVSVDGGANTLVDCYFSGTNNPGVAYTSSVLSAGVHTVTITCNNTKNASSANNQIVFDSIEVMPLPVQCLDVRNVFAHDTSFAAQAIADHKTNDAHSALAVEASINGTTTSASYVVIGSATLNLLFPAKVLAYISGKVIATNSGTLYYAAVGYDSLGALNEIQGYPPASGVGGPCATSKIITLPAGSHTFNFYAAINGGNTLTVTGTVGAIVLGAV